MAQESTTTSAASRLSSAKSFDLIKDSKIDGWAIDSELLVLAQNRHYTIKEIPVKWKEDIEKTNIKIVRDSMQFLKDMLRLRLRLWFG